MTTLETVKSQEWKDDTLETILEMEFETVNIWLEYFGVSWKDDLEEAIAELKTICLNDRSKADKVIFD